VRVGSAFGRSSRRKHAAQYERKNGNAGYDQEAQEEGERESRMLYVPGEGRELKETTHRQPACPCAEKGEGDEEQNPGSVNQVI